MNPWPIVTSAAIVAGTTAWGAVAASSELFGPTLRHTNSPRKLALTFDDGPNPSVTPKLLDLLDRYSARATFFLIGRYVRQSPGLAQDMRVRGHLVGNHTDTHANLFWASHSGIRDELASCQAAIQTAGGGTPQWMRPPYGFRNPWLAEEVRRTGMKGVVMWSHLCRDWKAQPPGSLIDRLSRIAHQGGTQGDIVVLHDGDHRTIRGDRMHVVTALEHWLPRWRDAGIEFVTIEQ